MRRWGSDQDQMEMERKKGGDMRLLCTGGREGGSRMMAGEGGDLDGELAHKFFVFFSVAGLGRNLAFGLLQHFLAKRHA
jgi:hypothetical protein